MPSPFVAQHAREVIEAGGALSAPLAVAWPNAVVAIIDVSGYTKLTNTLMEQEGSAGAAYVKEVLNPPLVLLVQTVHQAGGTVVKFAGDAVIACFGHDSDASDGRLPLLRSMLCSLQLLLSFADLAHQQYATSPAAVLTGSAVAAAQALNIHVGIGAGPVQHVHLGEVAPDPEEPTKFRREYFIAGTALMQAGDMLGHAKAGELAIPTTALERLETLKRYLSGMVEGNHAVVNAESHKSTIVDLIETLQTELGAVGIMTELGACEGRLEERADPTGYLRDMALSYVEESLAAVVRANASADEALRGTYDQIRRVTIVFVKLAGLDVGRLAEHPHLGRSQRCLLDILHAIRPYGGCLRQFCCDDKSTTALCVFGMAGFAHERGEERHALDAALKILRALGPAIQPSIGIATGPVFAGVVGDSRRSDGTVLGVCVNLAARIMSSAAAKGSVVCDSETWAAVGEGDAGMKFTTLPEVFSDRSAVGNEVLQGTPYYAYSEILKCIVDGLQRKGVTAKSISERMPRDPGALTCYLDEKVIIILDDMQWMELKPSVKKSFEQIANLSGVLQLQLSALTLEDIIKMTEYIMGAKVKTPELVVDVSKKIFNLAQGMQFNLEETASITQDVKGGSWSASYARDLIKCSDDFNFIQFVRNSNTDCFFTHNFIRQGILTTILPVMAEKIHLAFADSIEALMVAEEDLSRLTPLIYHLLRVSDPSLQKRKYRHVYNAFAASANLYRHVEVTVFIHLTTASTLIMASASPSKLAGLDGVLIILLQGFFGIFVESEEPYRMTAMSYQVAFVAAMGGLARSAETIRRLGNMDLTPRNADVLFQKDFSFATANKAIMAAIYCEFEECYLHQQWCRASILARSVQQVQHARAKLHDIISSCLILGRFSDMEKEAACAVERLSKLDEKDKDIRYFSAVTMLVAVIRGDAPRALKLYEQWQMDDSQIGEVRKLESFV
ncbi:Adenylate cyclase type 10 [Irineochytrium annulatum]|nr:Adenylate cyclase type 10 [Irineochytrium annulatum]